MWTTNKYSSSGLESKDGETQRKIRSTLLRFLN